jgi:hypothetical protein
MPPQFGAADFDILQTIGDGVEAFSFHEALRPDQIKAEL